MVPDAQGDVENGKVVHCHRLHQRNDRKPSDKERGKFDIKNDIFKVEQSPTDSSKLVLTINKQPIGDWFKEQFGKLGHGFRKAPDEPRKGGGFRL